MWENNERKQTFSEAETSSKKRNMKSRGRADTWAGMREGFLILHGIPCLIAVQWWAACISSALLTKQDSNRHM
jgi:hypothetical protein